METQSNIAFSLVNALIIQLEYNLLERQVFAFLIESKLEDVELERIYVNAHELYEKSNKIANYSTNALKLANKVNAIKSMIREFATIEGKCYFNF